MSVRIYVEGGGDQRAASAELRRGLSEFLKRATPGRSQPRIVACGSRNDTFDRFRIGLREQRSELALLLVDSEGPVEKGAGPWAHLMALDGWRRPDGATDDHAHLMVQCMESWLFADKETLADYYGQGFLLGALSRRKNPEEIPKRDVLASLQRATEKTRSKEAYHKIRHAADLLARLDPEKVRRASRHAHRFLTVLERDSSR